MPLITLFPRLSRLGVTTLLAQQDIAKLTFTERMKTAGPFVSHAASGGSRVMPAELLAIRNSILKIALAHGFPDSTSQSKKAAFDVDCAIWLVEHAPLPAGEALRDDVWAFLATCLLPDISIWRYGVVAERLHGGVRNVFQRLWMRGHALDRGKDHSSRWEILQALTEDAVVQLIERPSIAASKSLSLAIGEAWVRTAALVGPTKMEGITREAIRRIRIANEVIYIAALDDDVRLEFVANYFAAAAESVIRTNVPEEA